MGFRWSFEKGGFAGAPATNTVYIQAINGSELDLTLTNWNYGTNLLGQRFQQYRSAFANSIENQVPGLVTANGSVNGQIVGALPAFDAFILSFVTSGANNPLTRENRAHPLDDPTGGGIITNVPAYAWMSLVIPTNAFSMSFDYLIQGDWQNDSLAAALNGTNVLLMAGSEIQTNVLFSSGPIDVSALAGQTNEFFIGIVGGTSTNAQLTMENLVFSVSIPPLLQAQAQAHGGSLTLSWPLSAQNFNLQTTTNLADSSSWTTQTHVPAVVNFQNVITNPIAAGPGFYRLVQSTR
jgi:hypothetical protein